MRIPEDLFEGAQDSTHRRLADYLYKAVGNYFRSQPEPDETVPSNRVPSGIEAIFYCSKVQVKNAEVKQLLDRLLISFFMVPGGGPNASTSHGTWKTTLRIHVPGTKDVSPEEWKFRIWQEAGLIWKKRELDVKHELIHLIDLTRGNPEAVAGYDQDEVIQGGDSATDQYVHNDWEWNAIVQTTLMTVDRNLAAVSSWEEAKAVMGGSEKAFFEKFISMLGPYAKYMSPHDRRRLMKRALQYWSDKKEQLDAAPR